MNDTEAAFATGDRGKSLVITTAVFTVVALLFVIVRLYTRLKIIRNAGIDDVIIVVASGLTLLLAASVCLQVHNGQGRHVETMTLAQVHQIFKWGWMSGIMYNASLVVIKASILTQYMRLFVGPIIRRTCHITLGFILLYGTWILLGSIFGCRPISAFWTVTSASACFNELAFYFTNAAFNIITDIIILVTPMPVFNSLQLPRKQKRGLMAIFAVGGFVCITSILRLHALYASSVSRDITWDSATALIWSTVEVNVAIVCACLPTLKPIISLVFPRLLNGSRPLSARLSFISAHRASNQQRMSYRPGVKFPPESSSTSSTSPRVPEDITLDLGGGMGGIRGSRQRPSDEEAATEGMEIKVVTVLAQDIESRRESDKQVALPSSYTLQ